MLGWSFDRRLSAAPLSEVFFGIADWLALRATRISVGLTPRVDLISLAVALSATIFPLRKPFVGGGFFASPSEGFTAERLIEALYSYSIDSLYPSAERGMGSSLELVPAAKMLEGRGLCGSGHRSETNDALDRESPERKRYALDRCRIFRDRVEVK
jgi:hypothetical protein